MARYRWEDPFDWMGDKYSGDAYTLWSFIVNHCWADDIEGYFGSEMGDDGYYDLLIECPICNREFKEDDASICVICREKVCWDCIDGWDNDTCLDCLDKGEEYDIT